MVQAQLHRGLPAFLFLLLCLFDTGYCDLNSSIAYANLSQAFPPLGALYTTHLDKSPSIGGQNFTQCCLLAVSLSYIIQDGQPIKNPNAHLDFITASPSNLSTSQFPCGATYNGDTDVAQLVTVPYSWCNQNCCGWQQSSSAVLSQWVQPFVGFILPAAVFCLNVRAPCLRGTDLNKRNCLLTYSLGASKEGIQHSR
jgi:hypothetical protein